MNLLFLYVLYPLIYIFPAYAANGAPVLFGGGPPLDFGMKLDGKRVLGNNKTIRGTASALLAGIAVGAIEYPFMHYMLAIAAMLSIGAILGDLGGSFAKRRMGIMSGSSLPVLDQYGFVVLALLLAYPLGHMPDIYGLLFILALTGIAHVLTNMGAHRLRLKKVPW